ncbi:hypothetical protein [Actinocorallia populi]|uniref:hypothetical protein n=1 Tax=Actinocorallia populi TaxID=2079200 RepID=UPI000D088381|nr:hypothetical protein [Actinocorallia populi]
MGTDISGFVEYREPVVPPTERHVWQAAVELDQLYDVRDYDAFGCLFGVRNHAGFRPLAAGRGLPEDLSPTAREAAEAWPHHDATWISWAEVAAVDWDEPAETPDLRLHEYQRQADGALAYVGKCTWAPKLTEATGIPREDFLDGRVRWEAGQEFAIDDLVFRAEVLRRRDAVPADGNWQPVWRKMQSLAERAGPDGVRLVVWFDS